MPGEFSSVQFAQYRYDNSHYNVSHSSEPNQTSKRETLLSRAVRKIVNKIFGSKEPKRQITKPLTERKIKDITKLPSTSEFKRLKLSDGRTLIKKTETIKAGAGIKEKQTVEYFFITKAPPIKNLVISGGGAKGVVLPGAIKAFEKTKEGKTNVQSLRSQLENVAGSSIGAVNACFISVGMPADDIMATAKKEDYTKILGKGKGPVLKSGKPLKDFIRNGVSVGTKDSLVRVFSSGSPVKIVKFTDITDDMIVSKVGDKGEELVEEIKKTIQHLKKGGDLSFRMLQSLHKLAPETFKKLTITATCKENSQTFYFDADSTPHLSIATAARASASLPIILEPVKINPALILNLPEDLKNSVEDLTFIDGGYYDNIPVDIMNHKQDKAIPGSAKTDSLNKGESGANLQTLALVFDANKVEAEKQSHFLNHGVHTHSLYNPLRKIEHFLRDIIPQKILGLEPKFRNTTQKHRGVEKIRNDYTQRNIPFVVDLKTTDFKKAQKNEENYIKQGEAVAQAYLKNHKKEAISIKVTDFEDFKDKFTDLDSREELNKIEDFFK